MNIEQIADAVSKEMLGNVSTLQPELVKWNREYLRRCLSKLAEHDVEPVAWQDAQTGMIYTAVSPAAKHLYSPIYAETQLLASQQRTAYACAKVCDEIAVTAWGCDSRFAEAIRNGEWREYL